MRHDSAEIAGSRVRLEYTVDLHYEVLGDADFVFSIHAAHTGQQRVLHEAVVVEPAVAWRVDTEPIAGNRLLRLATGTGALDVHYAASVEVAHHVAEPDRVVAGGIADLPADVLPF